MRDGAPSDVIRQSAGWACSVSSWLAGRLLADDIPVIGGTASGDRANLVPERITLTVPRFTSVNGDYFDWLPGEDTEHPLAKFGQRLQLSFTVTAPSTGRAYVTQFQTYAIQSWAETGDGSIQVEAAGVLQLASDERFISPTAASGTFSSQFRRLLPVTLTGATDGGLVDRGVPSTFNWGEDRLSAMYELADAWPARIRTDPTGLVRMLPVLPEAPVPEIVFKDGADGTLVTAPRSDTRAGTANQVTAESEGGITVTVSQLNGPMAVTGPYGVVSYRFSSGALTTEAEVKAAANAKLADLLRGSRSVTVTAAPDPRIDIDDAVSVVSEKADTWGWVDSYEMPLTVNDGPMTLTVSVQ